MDDGRGGFSPRLRRILAGAEERIIDMLLKYRVRTTNDLAYTWYRAEALELGPGFIDIWDLADGRPRPGAHDLAAKAERASA